MRTTLRMGLLGMVLGVIPAHALATGPALPPIKVDAGINAHFHVHVLDWNGMAHFGPWYQYFPYEAYFQTPAPYGHFPNWPSPMVTPPGQPPYMGVAPAPAPAPGPPQPPPANAPKTAPPEQLNPPTPQPPLQGPPLSFQQNPQPQTTQPVGYFYPAAPSYWYGR